MNGERGKKGNNWIPTSPNIFYSKQIFVTVLMSSNNDGREDRRQSSKHSRKSSSSDSSSSAQERRQGRQRRDLEEDNIVNGVVPLRDQDEIPIQYKDRNCTDVCCLVVGIAFTLIMIIIAFAVFDYDTYVKSSFPTDSDGRLCAVQAPAYPLVYFANPPEIGRRVCVSSCPSEGDVMLGCYATKDVGCRFSDSPIFGVSYYESYPDVGRIGAFCLPKDDTLRAQLLQNAGLRSKGLFMNSIDVIQMCMLFAIVLAIVFLAVVQCCARAMTKVVVGLALVMLLALVICLLIYPTDHPAKVPLGIIIIILFLFLICSYVAHRRELDMLGVFMEHATKVLKDDKCCVFSYVLLFWVLTFGFLMLLIWEFKCFWGGGSLSFDKDKSVFWVFEGAGSAFLTVLLGIQAYWGLSFLKEASNYCVSAQAVDYYFRAGWGVSAPLKSLVLKHFGSVIGGSFMTGFFGLGDFIFDLLKGASGCNSIVKRFCMPCLKLFELVRSDSMAYINITGIPYCNASRTCEYLCDNSMILEEAQSSSRVYRLCAHIFLIGINCILALYIKGNVSPMALLVIFALTFFIVTFSISIHADIAEALVISFLTNEEWEKRKRLQTDPVFNAKDRDAFPNLAMNDEDLKRKIIEHWREKVKEQQA